MRNLLFLAVVLLGATTRAAEIQSVIDLADPILRTENRLTHAAFSPDGQRVVTASELGLGVVWTVTDRQKRWLSGLDLIPSELRRPGRKKPNLSWLRDARFSPDGEEIAFAGSYGNVWIYTLNTAQVRFLTGHTEDARTVEFSPDGQTLVSTSDDATVRFWSRSGRALKTLDLSSAGRENVFTTSATFSPDGRTVIATRSDGYIASIDTRTFQMVERRAATANNMAIWQASFAPDGRSFATASEDGEVAVWSLAPGAGVARSRTLRAAGSASANAVAFSPDGRILAVATSANKERNLPARLTLIRAENGDELLSLRFGRESLSSVSFSPDGRILVSSYGGTASVVDVPLSQLIQ